MNGNEVYTNFHHLGVPEERVQCDCTLINFIDSLFVYEEQTLLRINLDEFTYKIGDKQMTSVLTIIV